MYIGIFIFFTIFAYQTVFQKELFASLIASFISTTLVAGIFEWFRELIERPKAQKLREERERIYQEKQESLNKKVQIITHNIQTINDYAFDLYLSLSPEKIVEIFNEQTSNNHNVNALLAEASGVSISKLQAEKID